MAKEKFNQVDLERACNALSLLKYWPSDGRGQVMILLQAMCPHKEALEWLVQEAINHVGEWPGPAELRGLLCTRYDAADGVDQPCSLVGYSPAECESRHFERHKALVSGGQILDELPNLNLRRLTAGDEWFGWMEGMTASELAKWEARAQSATTAAGQDLARAIVERYRLKHPQHAEVAHAAPSA